ncbi:MAG: purine-nucleoside phosphorylase [Pseudomonadota bacterium]
MNTNVNDAMATIRKFAPNAFPKVGIILGSGLGGIAEQITNPITIPFQAFGLTSGTVAGHASLLVFGNLNDTPVVCLKGRLHLYEGASYEALRTYIRILKHLGVRSLVLTASVGSLREDIVPGDIVIVNDHINFQPGNPLQGPNDESMGPRFVDLQDAYDPGLITIFKRTAERLTIPVKEGIYISTLGPSFETPAEIRMFQLFGADLIGMSVVAEVILARHTGMRVFSVAAVTNMAVGLSDQRVTHELTLQQGEIAARKLVKLIPAFLKDGEAELNA